MPTGTSQMKFNLSSLRETALEALDSELERVRKVLEEKYDPDTIREHQEAWKAEQEKRILKLADDISDNQVDFERLSTFQLSPMPKIDERTKEMLESEILDLQSRRERTAARADSLVPDKDGNISLTKTQLREFFNL